MGYSITHEQHERLERLRREDRLCAVSTGRGGCFNRATWEVLQETWPYRLDDGKRTVHRMTLCGRHVQAAGFEGGNFRVLRADRLP